MKKLLSLILSSLIICATTACSSNDTVESSATTVTDATQTTTTTAEIKAVDTEVQESLEELDYIGFEGVVYAVKDGKTVASFSKGTQENGETITIDTPMPIGSVSKQFCAAAILLLQEHGKLSVEDTLDKYFPEYSEAKKITLSNMLSMRSGITNFTQECFEIVSVDKTEEENTAALKNWIFSQKLDFEPDDGYTYSNSNFFLLGNIVEQVSGKKYIDFLRESFFTPLGMTHTGSIGELSFSPEWAQGITYQKVDLEPGLTKGAGDIISNATDMELWMSALYNGKSISAESYKAMTTDYSAPSGRYGYGMDLEIVGGVGHSGLIGCYVAYDYINEDNDLVLFMASNNVGPSTIEYRLYDLLSDLLN